MPLPSRDEIDALSVGALRRVDEKFGAAIECVMTSAYPLRDRLVDAWVSHLGTLDAADTTSAFPAGERREAWMSLVARVRTRYDDFLGWTDPSIRAMTDDEVHQMLVDILSLYRWLVGAIARGVAAPATLYAN